MRPPRVRFTIGNLMIAIAAVAGLLALPTRWTLIVIALAVPLLSWIGSRWLISRRHRGLAAFGFWFVATSTNILVSFSCVAPDPRSYSLISIILVVTVIPTMVAFGRAWVLLLAPNAAASTRFRRAATCSVFLLAVLPILTLWTLWPLRVAFLSVRPAMERLADRVAAGKPVVFPRRVGLFRIAAPATEPVSGYPGLLIRANPYTSPGFVRIHSGSRRNTHGPIVGVFFDVHLGGGWWYRR